MSQASEPETVERIEIFTQWLGFAAPPVHAAKLRIIPRGHQFVREQALAGATDTIPEERVKRVLAVLAEPPIPELDPSRFDVPESVIKVQREEVQRGHQS